MLGGFWQSKQVESVDPSSMAAVSPEPASIKIELLSDTGPRILASGTLIQTQSEIKRLVLNGKHHLTLNANTLLSIEPVVWSGKTGCLVNLRLGEIYAEIEHDGNPCAAL